MKKIFCMILAVAVILSLCACGGSAGVFEKEEEKPRLEIGYGKVNITPNYSVGLSSSGDEKNRRSTGIVSYLFATCIAVRFGQETYLMYTVDTISISEELGGFAAITTFGISVTGIFGYTAGPALCKIFKIHHPIAQGVSFGTAVHVIGSAKATEMHQLAGAVASLSLTLAGLITVVILSCCAQFL